MNLSGKKKAKQLFEIIWVLIAALLGSATLCLLRNLWYTLRYIDVMDFKDMFLLAQHFSVRTYLFTALLLFFTILYWKKHSNIISRVLYQYRFLIVIIIWILCIIFNINGSSVACWGDLLGKAPDARGLLLGVNRRIRTDEWATYTPMMLSQQFGLDGTYPYFSKILRGTATDTFIVYGLPVKDIAVLFRPFHWGFLFLGIERGFSFYWCGRIIALAVVSFEFGMLITRKNKLYAFIIALLFTLSPTVQWWVGVNGLVEMLIFSQLSVLLIFRYMHTDNFKIRILCGFLLIICAGGFILVFYPAWQVPIAYITLGLLTWVILKSWKKFHFYPRKDIPLMAACLFLLGIGMSYIILKSSDAISATLNTVYPGNRINCGGGTVFEMLRYGGNFFLPFVSDILPNDLPNNQCELSVFISFAPLGLILTFFVIIKRKKADLLLVILFIINGFLHSFMIFRYPSVLAKITLLSRTTPERITQIIGILDILMLFRALSLLKRPIRLSIAAVFSLFSAILISFVNRSIYKTYLSEPLLYGLTAIVFLGSLLLLCSKKKYLKVPVILFFSILMFISGGLINPVQHGFDVIYDTDLMKEIEKIVSKDPGGLWICDSLGYPMNNYFIMGGAPTIDSISTYPALKHWELLDPHGKYEDIYNRYAHITTILHNDDVHSNMKLGKTPDSFTLSLNTNDLKKLHISYVASNRDLTELESENVTFEQIASAQNVSIFRVKYNTDS